MLGDDSHGNMRVLSLYRHTSCGLSTTRCCGRCEGQDPSMSSSFQQSTHRHRRCQGWAVFQQQGSRLRGGVGLNSPAEATSRYIGRCVAEGATDQRSARHQECPVSPLRAKSGGGGGHVAKSNFS